MEKLTREQMIDLVGRFQRAEIADDDIPGAMDALIRSTGNPHVSDLIFYPETEMTAEQIVDKALQYRPIQL